MNICRFLVSATVVICFSFVTASAQKARPKPVSKAKPIIFAVISDGKMVEPVAYIDNGKLTEPVSGGEEPAKLSLFHKNYYKTNAPYRLIFGGADAGNLTVKSSDPKSDCASNMAYVTVAAVKAKLKGNVMALATNAVSVKKGSGLRRLPSSAERAEIEALVRSELIKQKVASSATKSLKYHNLTAVDVDSDSSPEMVGSFWVETGPTSRALLFFIAAKGPDSKYTLSHSEFQNIEQKDVMSGEISSIDEGVGNERLLDVFDFDNDGVAEIFTYTQSFEGAGFNVYRRESGKWIVNFEGSNYHCAY